MYAFHGVISAPALPVVGSNAADFQAKYGDCVKVATRFNAKGGAPDAGPREGDAYELDAAKPACATTFPALVGQTVAVVDGKIFNVVASDRLERTEYRRLADGGSEIVTDGGNAVKTGAK